MRWEDQGRQGHGQFGNGTSGNEPVVAERPVDVVAAIARAAVAALGGAAGRRFGLMLDQGGMTDLRGALPVWASAAEMTPEQFRGVMAGPVFTIAGAAALQEAGQVSSGQGGDAAAASVAGAKLAAAFVSVAEDDYGYALNYAADMARYAVANDIGAVSRKAGLEGLSALITTQSGPTRDCFAECAHLLQSPSRDLQNSEFRKCYRECAGSLGG